MSNEKNINNKHSSNDSELAKKRSVTRMKEARRKKRRQQAMIRRTIIFGIGILVVIVSLFVVQLAIRNDKAKKAKEQAAQEQQLREEQQKATTQKEAIAMADNLAAGYDYDAAIELLKAKTDIDTNGELVKKISEYEGIKESLVEADVETIPHVFFHILVAEPEITWNLTGADEYKIGDYNQVMTTIDEFKKIIKQMYDNDYVLIKIRDMVEETTNEAGDTVFTKGKIMLPEGKKPFVMSQDDTCYYFYMIGDGYATKMVVGEDGRPTNEYTKPDGTIVTGSYDLVPVLNDFIDEYPDFSYKGAKAILAFTGYNGVLGYRTDPDLAKTEAEGNRFATEYGVFNTEEEIAKAKPVVEALKADGWEFASHSYGHISYGSSFEKVKEDADKWQERVANVIGPTDILIYPFGTDIGGWQPYSADNEKYEYLKGQGFRFFCNVDSNPYWVQITEESVRQGRINLDGYRMYQDLYNGADKLSQLFDVQSVFDHNRPETGLKEWDSTS